MLFSPSALIRLFLRKMWVVNTFNIKMIPARVLQCLEVIM